ncbi:hypothetical protein JCM11641_005144 [Rhodosporidiobolus odoratus]
MARVQEQPYPPNYMPGFTLFSHLVNKVGGASLPGRHSSNKLSSSNTRRLSRASSDSTLSSLACSSSTLSSTSASSASTTLTVPSPPSVDDLLAKIARLEKTMVEQTHPEVIVVFEKQIMTCV